MNRSRSASETSVGLFAFLDVLMSTMGSLILVLMVVTPKIRQESVAKAAAAAQRATVQKATEASHAAESQGPLEKTAPTYTPPRVIELPRETVDLNAKLKVQLAELSQETQDRRRIAEDKHEALGSAQATLKKSQAELEELEQRLEQILRAKSRLAESAAKVSNDGVAIESQLASAAARLRTLHGQIANASTAYTFVAYDGVSGTTRRPILVECSREHIKFLQENVALSSTDVSGYSPSYNPLQAGSQALLDYWATHSAPDEPRPYILLVVRPNGAVAYATARRLLERMKDPFGYELLPDDQKLDIPPPVPEAAEICRRAVEKAISERVDVFKQVFGNTSRAARGNKLAGSGSDPSGSSRGANGGSASPFDDLGDDSSPGTKTAGKNVASVPGSAEAGQSASPPGQPGTNGGTGAAAIAQSQTGNAGSGSAQTGTAGEGASRTTVPGSSKSGMPTPGTGTSGEQGSGVMLSDTGPLATGRTTPVAGTSMLGIGTPGTESTGVSGSGSGLPGPLPGDVGNGTSQAGGPPGTGLGKGAFSRDSPGAGLPGGTSPGAGSTGPGSTGSRSHDAGSPGGGLPSGGLPSGSVPSGGVPSGGLPGGDSSQSGRASMGGPAETGAAAGVAASSSEFPPSIIPRSGAAGEAPSLGTGSDRLTVGHPTPGADGNETADGQVPSQTSRPSGSSLGSLGAGSGLQSESLQAGLGQAGSATQSSAAQSGSAASSPGQTQSSELATTPGGSGGQSQSGQSSGSPSSGSPSAGSPSSGGAGDEGQSAPGSDTPPNSRAMDGIPSFATGSEDDAAPRRANQQSVHRWGISSPRANIGFEHDVAVYVEAGRICVGGQRPIRCGQRETSDQLSFAVLRALELEVRTWGRPRENFYWVPALKIVICPGGIVQYERIEPALERHGLSATVDFRLELSKPSPLPRLVTE